MTESQKKKQAKAFADRWKDKGYEKGQSQLFWIDLLEHVYGVDDIAEFVEFEDKVKLDTANGFIDVVIPSTKVMIEQKSIEKDLNAVIKQSDGSTLTPFQQAKRYIVDLPVQKHPNYVITCNFREFYIYDMNKPHDDPEILLLKDLPKEYHRLDFIVNQNAVHFKREMEISIKAGELVGKIYDLLHKQYVNPDSAESLRSLNILCVRLVFCLYAEDSDIFPHNAFGDFLKPLPSQKIRKNLKELFQQVLDKPIEQRDPYLEEELSAFPYVNGGLFSDENIEIPNFTDEIKDVLINELCAFDWKDISPTIFGAIFESTLNPETRRSGGMHYTSIENIHKVIDPLFLDDLKEELEILKALPNGKVKVRKLEEFRQKLATLVFLDPACGSGNFLTETYMSIRRLENDAVKAIRNGQITLFGFTPIYVSIHQFYGIEINDFAVSVAKTALWIAEHKMLQETEEITQVDLDFLPLKTYTNIHEGNALRINWEDVVPKDKLSYIIGNPPFVGFTYMTSTQKEDMQILFPGVKNLDFVCGWYKKASDLIINTKIECGFVSTNSIVQGESIGRLWKFLNIKINFAHTSFIWDSEANLKAHVHCVIIGFSNFERDVKTLYIGGTMKNVKNINPYLCDAPSVIVMSKNKPLCDVPKMIYGNKPADGGFLIIEETDYDDFISKDPNAVKFVKKLIGATEFINNKNRYCLWLDGANPSELKKCPQIMKRVAQCKEKRENSIASGIRKFAETPTLFAQITQPVGIPYILVPCTSSEKRKYVPIGFIDGDVIATNAVQIIPNASIYHFGVLTSNVHMAWMRTVCGRLEMRYRYSKDIVYNNFPWCTPTEKQKEKIEQTAQMILDARAKYPDCSLADLYDDLTMPPELRKAHNANDKAVLEAYGFDTNITESECVSNLMKMYQKLVDEQDKK